MPVKEIKRVSTICKSVNIGNGGLPVVIYENNDLIIGTNYFPGYKIITWNTYIKDLRCFAIINSLDAIAMPEFNFDDSETTKLYKALDVEWKSPRKQLDLMIQVNNTWFEVGSISLLNPMGYPYRVYNLMEIYTNGSVIEANAKTKLGARVKDVGYGLLDTTDKLTIYGSCVEEIILEHPEQSFSDFVFPQPITNVYIQGGGSDNTGGSSNTDQNNVNNDSYINNDFIIRN